MSEPTKEDIIARAAFRKEQIEMSTKRIVERLKTEKDPDAITALERRLIEYGASMECINFTLKTGVYVGVKGHQALTSAEGVK